MQAKAVLLATGGGPTMYKYHTPSGDKSCDGLAMALRAGLPLRDMEMVQFHPTGLLAGTGTRMTGTVLEEGLRGAGGYLLERRQASASWSATTRALERATRDIVSRAIFAEMRAGPHHAATAASTSQMSHLGADNVRRQFKGMVERCADCGFDLAGGLVEVVPTAHYMMGGVVFGADCTHARCTGLFAAGEDTGGVHGANRLGGNGVANSTVFGGIAGDTMAAWVRSEGALASRPTKRADRRAASRAHEAPFAQPPRRPRADPRGALTTACGTTSASCATRRRLARAPPRRWPSSTARLARTGVADGDRAFNLSWHDWLNLESLIAVSRAIAAAALAREDSRGAHFREDHPQPGDLATSSYIVVQQRGPELGIRRERVRFTRVAPGQTVIAE